MCGLGAFFIAVLFFADNKIMYLKWMRILKLVEKFGGGGGNM